MKIKINKKESLDEISAVSGGGAHGHSSGVPLSDKKTLKKFNDKQEKEQRLKGEPLTEMEELEEMFSSSGAMMGSGSGQGPYERSPEGHKRYIRMRYELQKNKVFKPNRYFAENEEKLAKIKIKIKKKILRESNFDQELSVVLSKYNIEHEVGGTLGMGKYGLVVPGVSDDYGPVAIKVLQSSAPSTKREVENYKTVSAARSKSPYLKKHFPEVYHIDKSNPQFTLIIMERLYEGEAAEHEMISMLFGGLNTTLRATEDEREVGAEDDRLFRSRQNRYYMMFKDKDSQDSIIQDFYDNTVPELNFLDKTIRNFFSYLDAYVSNKSYSQKKLQLLNILPLSDDAKTYLNNWMTGKPKAIFEDAPWMMTFIIEQLDDLEQHENKSLFGLHHEDLIMFWLYWFRQNSPVGMRSGDNTAYELDDVGAQPEQFAVFKEARSIHKAIMILKDVTGLQASDMHDRNVMVRPETGDIVIVDLGLFRKI